MDIPRIVSQKEKLFLLALKPSHTWASQANVGHFRNVTQIAKYFLFAYCDEHPNVMDTMYDRDLLLSVVDWMEADLTGSKILSGWLRQTKCLEKSNIEV